MEIHNFNSGTFVQQTGYKSFSPNRINLEWVVSDPEINVLLANANRFLGELNAFSQLIPDVEFFISMHILKEATTSSRIEGTKTNMEDVLVKQLDVLPEKRDDWAEVRNYISAINYAVAELEKLPISTRLIKNSHRILLDGVRGKNKLPGEYRSSQNWIGASLKDAVFIPPHFTEIADLMSDLEKFIHNDEIHVPHLLKIAIVHYQFETIHPFLDGNGRLGRLLITLYLVSTGLLTKPALYLSDFFERNRTQYYDNLMAVRVSNNLMQWIKFFLVGITETAKNSINVFKSIIELRRQIELEKLPLLGNKIEKGLSLLTLLYQKPIIESKEITDSLNISAATANRLINQFTELGILVELTGYKRNRKFIFKEYFEIFQSK